MQRPHQPCGAFCLGVWLTRLPPTRFPPPAVVLLLRPVDTWQDLPYASGEGGAGERVKSASAFPGKPEQQKDYMSDLAVAESVAALGEFCRNVEITGAYQQPQHKQRHAVAALRALGMNSAVHTPEGSAVSDRNAFSAPGHRARKQLLLGFSVRHSRLLLRVPTCAIVYTLVQPSS